MPGFTAQYQNRETALVAGVSLLVAGILGVSLLASCSSSPTIVLSRQQRAYVGRFLSGSGNYTHVVFLDRTIRADRTTFYYSPTIAADRMLADYVRRRVREGVAVQIARDLPPAVNVATPSHPEAPVATVFHGGVVYIEILSQRWRHLNGTQISEVIPAVYVYGDPAVVRGPVLLTEPAPGDVPCQPYCRSAEQTFNAVRGRIDLILRNVAD